jgi:protein-tyrosine phosphatase
MVRRLKSLLPRPLKREVRRILQNIRESAAYRYSRPGDRAGAINHIVFVCKGNICRSAFAELYLKTLIQGGGYKIESCGLDVDQGTFSPPEAVRVGREFGLALNLHRSRSMAACDLKAADLIVPMEYQQYRRLIELLPGQRGKIKLLRDFAPFPKRFLSNIYDPFGQGEREFRRCFRRLREALEGLRAVLPDAREARRGTGGAASPPD